MLWKERNKKEKLTNQGYRIRISCFANERLIGMQKIKVLICMLLLVTEQVQRVNFGKFYLMYGTYRVRFLTRRFPWYWCCTRLVECWPHCGTRCSLRSSGESPTLFRNSLRPGNARTRTRQSPPVSKKRNRSRTKRAGKTHKPFIIGLQRNIFFVLTFFLRLCYGFANHWSSLRFNWYKSKYAS